jgi:acetyltransferase-like isoleucine patch superfamily enzyme
MDEWDMSGDLPHAGQWLEQNRRQFAKVNFVNEQFPTILGEILVAKFAQGGTIRIGADVHINSAYWANPVGGIRTCFLIKGDQAVIEIGDRVGMSNVLLAARTHIKVGARTNLGAGAKILDTDFHSLNLEEREADINIPSAPVIIGEGVFIGADAMVLKGVTIGDRSVIGARSLVVKSVPPGEIWGGNPARFIRKL